MKNELRKIPSNLEIEQVYLGAVLINNEALNQASEFIREEHFYEPVHQLIFNAITRIIDSGLSANVFSIRAMLCNNKEFINMGGNEYIARIATMGSTIINSLEYAKIIFDLAKKRALISYGEQIVNTAYETSIEISAYNQIESAESKLFLLATEGSFKKEFISLSKSIESSISTINKAMKSTSHVTGIDTGYKKLNDCLLGFHNSDLVIIAARPSMGKTAFAINLAMESYSSLIKNLEEGNNKLPSVGIFSLEMSAEQLSTRMLSMLSEINSSALRSGKLNEQQYNNVRKKSEELAKKQIYIDDTPSLSISAIRTRAKRMKRKNNLSILFIDYLQLIRGNNTKSENRVQEVSEITQGLKALAKELNIPIIALSQLSRAVEQREEKRPMLSDLRDSGSIEQDADIVMFLYREDYYLMRQEPKFATEKHVEWQRKLSEINNIAEIIIAKHRNGPIGTVSLYYDKNYSKFRNLENKNR
jgi:replicative DNA helicase